MQIVYLGIVFAVIIILLACKRPLYQAILGGLLAWNGTPVADSFLREALLGNRTR